MLLSVNDLNAENYRIYLLGMPIVKVDMESSSNVMKFNTQTIGFIQNIWSVDNYYITEFDSLSFGVRKYTKNIQQGSYSGILNCKYDSTDSSLTYNGNLVSVPDSIQNIFTLLARVSRQSSDYLDTKWFPMDHEGTRHRARFLLADIEKVKIGNEEVLCDHYRLDIEQTDETSIQVSPYDYFMDHVASGKALRQVWVEQNGKKRIIKASVSIYGMTVSAVLQDN